MAKPGAEVICRCTACHCSNKAVGATVCWLCANGHHKPRRRR